MKEKKSGCCFVFLCLLFLLPGLFFVRDWLPGLSFFQEKGMQIRKEIREVMDGEEKPLEALKETFSTKKAWEKTEEEIADLLSAGEGVNSCAYYYWTLDENLQAVYMTILNSLDAMVEDIDVGLDQDTMNRMMSMVFSDHPELFFVDQSYRYSMYEQHIVIHPEYNCGPEEREQRAQVIEATVRDALQYIPEEPIVYEYIKAMYCYVIDTVDYELDSPDNQNIFSSMGNHVSVCSGYARELQYLLQRIGIQAIYVSGTVENSGPHAWVIALCDGEYYHVDPTFGDPGFSEVSEEEADQLPVELQEEFLYLCCDDETIYRDRSADAELPIPTCSSKVFNYYTMTGQYYTDCGDDFLFSIQNNIEAGKSFWQGQFADESSYKEAFELFQDGTIANLILANHPDWPSVHLHMAYKDEVHILKMWYE